ncbi:hypothetical protein MTR67_034074 [Solanum verrucosum]|uniref:Uncharacterized protein n=1 Tax=Solanum verrucosum TaxID=315347 RepID=A0AAF0U7Q8_SOLVR|nr:hypothetical protein MTR67_034074 [Solanum verrucosum]
MPRGPIYDVFVADVRQAGYMDWPGSSSANNSSILKPSNREELPDETISEFWMLAKFASDLDKATQNHLNPEAFEVSFVSHYWSSDDDYTSSRFSYKCHDYDKFFQTNFLGFRDYHEYSDDDDDDDYF